MSSNRMRIAVVGCGAAGAAAAVFLKRDGHEVLVFEQAPECRAVGAGFLMQPSGMEVLRELVSLFWSIRVKDDFGIRNKPLQEWKDEVLELCPLAKDLLDQISGWDDVLTARYGDVRMRKWHGEIRTHDILLPKTHSSVNIGISTSNQALIAVPRSYASTSFPIIVLAETIIRS